MNFIMSSVGGLGRGSWSLCLSGICLLAVHMLICVTFSLPPGVGVSCGLRLNDGLDIKLSQVGWGLVLCLWPGSPWFN